MKSPAGSPLAGRPPIAATLRLEGDYWTLVFGDAVLHLRDNKGLRYLSRLLDHPGTEMDVSALTADDSPGRSIKSTEAVTAEDIQRARSAVTKRIRAAIARIEHHHADLGRHLRANVRTGVHCVYCADPVTGVVWRVGQLKEEAL